MKRQAQPQVSEDGQYVLDQYRQTLQQFEDISPVTMCNYLSDLRLFIAWREDYWRERQEDRNFTPQAVAPSLFIRYREYLQTLLGLKPTTVNRTFMSLKRYFGWTRKTQLIQADPASSIKFVPKEAAPPRHLCDEEEEALVAAVNAVGPLRDQTIIILLLNPGLHAQELCTLTRQQIYLSKRNGTMRIIGKRKKVREIPLNSTARLALNQYFETHCALTGQALGHLMTKYATQVQVADIGPHNLCYSFGYRMAEVVPLDRLAQIMGHDSQDTLCSMCAEPSKIYNRMWRKSHGYKRSKETSRNFLLLCS
jgi:integrase/recombinase XerD